MADGQRATSDLLLSVQRPRLRAQRGRGLLCRLFDLGLQMCGMNTGGQQALARAHDGLKDDGGCSRAVTNRFVHLPQALPQQHSTHILIPVA